VAQAVEPLGVGRLELVAGDDQDMVGQYAPVEVFQNGEGVRSRGRQERVGGAVEDLQRRDVRPEVTVQDEMFNSVGIGHECSRLALVPQPVGVADAVGAVQRAALDVVQTQPALAVLDHLPGTLGQAVDLMAGEQRYGGWHDESPE